MAIHQPKKAQLADLEGRGFAYTETNGHQKNYQGVFFLDDEESLENLQEKDEITFSGTVYDDRRGTRIDTIPVTITEIVSTPAGQRADFVCTENE